MIITNFTAEPISLITQDGRQLTKLCFTSDTTDHILLRILDKASGEVLVAEELPVSAGEYRTELLLPCRTEDTDARWELRTLSGEQLYCMDSLWKKPREWTFYVMISSHTDIGLHHSQYHQRLYSEKFLDEAAALCDATDDRPEENRYRYTMEGRWFWENYPADRGNDAAEAMLRDYIRPGKIGLCAGIAGNHTHVLGFEELCRSAYGRRKILRDWGVDSRTMCMIDNNGMSWAMVAPYADAGYENLIFSPNHWNPLPTTRWYIDKSVNGYTWNSNAGGGGARCDVRYDSALPMLFFWRSPDDARELLVWASAQYARGGEEFGFISNSGRNDETLFAMKERFAARLPEMEERYPIDVWLLASYEDDQRPSIAQTDLFAAWNEAWAFPKIRTLGNPDEPFRIVREKFADKIPVLRGEMTGGWYQHPAAAPQLLADKLEADRRLANAETFASLAALHGDYAYPTEDFTRAWEYLFWNDEHSYGTSGYQGRRVYETWMQHRDWIEKAAETAATEADAALDAIAAEIPGAAGSYAVFNPTARTRDERVRIDGREAVVRDIPPCGYRVAADFAEITAETAACDAPPVVENTHYRVAFAADGSMRSIFDKALGRELLTNDGGANRFVYTEDNHKTFVSPTSAAFTVTRRDGVVTVTAEIDEPTSGAHITQTVTLDDLHRRIDIDNRLTHIRAMINNCRYYRYIYYAFPFAVEHARRICQLNGAEAEYARDLTGHGTDTYMSAHEWAMAENGEFGAALLQRDSLLIEFDHIHPDKTDCGAAGDGSAMYSYVSNDWLQMHEVGGSHVNLRLRYAITSWLGDSRDAGIREMAECFVNPVTAKPLTPGGTLPTDAHSFVNVPEDQRLVCLKRAEDGDGIIARLYGTGAASVDMDGRACTRCTVDERPAGDLPPCAFTTLRIDAGILPRRADTPDVIDEAKPAPIGSVWTGLISKPRAARGERDGHLYLLWGQNMEKNLSHYELYRSTEPGFVPSAENFAAKVESGEYRMGRYVDEGLASHMQYFYRVRAVNTDGVCGDFSEEFSGITKELIL